VKAERNIARLIGAATLVCALLAATGPVVAQDFDLVIRNGHVVAPGFIDTHWHYDRPWSNKLALRDGRPTVLDLEIGTHGCASPTVSSSVSCARRKPTIS